MFEEDFKIINNTLDEQKSQIEQNKRLINNLQIAIQDIAGRLFDFQTKIDQILKYNGLKGRDLRLAEELIDTHTKEIISLKQHLHELELNKENE